VCISPILIHTNLILDRPDWPATL